MTLRVGIAGYGLAGRLIHAPLLRGCGFDVVAIQTTNQERITQVEQDLPDASICSTVEEMFAHQLDLLVVASANIVHAEQAFAAIAAGVPVVIDKPMGRTYAETASIIQAGEDAHVPVCCFFNRRWDSDALTIKRVLKSGTLGTIHRMESRFERFRPEINPLSWRENMSAIDGGGQLLDLQPHLISSALDFFGEGTLVSSSVRSLRGAADDDSVLVVQHKSGVMSYLSASAVVGSPGPRVRILGSNGALMINDLDPQEHLLRAGKIPHNGAWDVSTASPAFIHRGDVIEEIPAENGNYAVFYREVEGAIKGLNPWPVDNKETLMVAKIIDQARASSVHG